MPTDSTTSTPAVSKRYSWYVVFLSMTVYICNYADRTLLGVLLEPIRLEFGVSDTVMGFVGGTLFATTYGLFTIPMGLLADRINRRKMLTVCLAIWSGMTLLSGFARNLFQLAAAQMMVAASESGGPPTMSSLISDLFARTERALAVAVWFTGVSTGVFVGYSLGGFLVDSYGWRQAFIWLGAPGLILAVIVWLTMRETPRGLADGVDNETPKSANLKETLNFFGQQKALRHALAGLCLSATTSVGPIVWLPTFYVRSYDTSLAEVGLVLGLIFGITGLIGGPLGGAIMNRLGKKNIRWHAGINVIVLPASIPPILYMYLAPTLEMSYYACVFWQVITAAVPVVTLTLLNNLAAVQFRGLTIALTLLLLNLIGYALGSQLIGLGSDLLADTFALGKESLRYAMSVMVVFSVWGAFHFWIASRHIQEGYDFAASLEKQN